MEYTFKDSNGNMIFSIESEDAVTSAEGFGKVLNVITSPSQFMGLWSPILGTVYNSMTSVGEFNSGEKMMNAPEFKNKLKTKIASKYNEFPSIDEIKHSDAKTKSGFIGWILGSNVSGDKVKKHIGSTSMKLKKIDGIPCAVISLTPIAGSFDLKQIAGYRVLIATAFVKSSGKVKSIPLCRGYLNKGGIVNKSGEAFIIDTDNAEIPDVLYQ